MSGEVVFLGFWQRGVDAESLEGKRVWTLNDYYQTYTFLMPERIYQVHDYFDGKAHDGRFQGDWRSIYEASGAQIVTTTPMGFKRERAFNIDEMVKRFGAGFFGSTFSYMFADAICEGVKLIDLQGIRLKQCSEYEAQVPCMLHNIETARELGIKVLSKYEEDWRRKGAKAAEYRPKWVDWANLYDGDLRYGASTNNKAREAWLKAGCP